MTTIDDLWAAECDAAQERILREFPYAVIDVRITAEMPVEPFGWVLQRCPRDYAAFFMGPVGTTGLFVFRFRSPEVAAAFAEQFRPTLVPVLRP